MADNNLKIQITTAADTAGVQQADKALTMLGGTAAKTNSQTNTLTNGVTSVGKASGNSGRSLLLFSQGLEDAQYGVRGILNNIPGLVIALGGGAGLAGALSIAAVGMSVVYEWLGKTDKKAKETKGSLNEWADDAKKVYQELSDLGAEDREKRAKEIKDGTKQALDAIKDRAKVDQIGGEVDGARARAQNLLDLAQQRLDLAQTEAVLAVATGTKLLELTKQREASVIKIYQTELQTADIPRQIAEAGAEKKLGEAQGSEQVTASAAAAASAAAQAAKQEAEGLRAEAAAKLDERRELTAEAAALRARKLELEKQVGGFGEMSTPDRLDAQNEIQRKLVPIDAKIKDLEQAASALIGQAGAEQSKIDTLAAAAEEATKAQQEASAAMLEASRSLDKIRELGQIGRETDAGLKAGELGQEALDTGAVVTGAANKAITGIGANAAKSGRPINLTEQDTIDQLNQIKNDATPDSQQGGQLAGIVQLLANNLTAKDSELIKMLQGVVTIAKGQETIYKGLQSQINDLTAKVNQKP